MTSYKVNSLPIVNLFVEDFVDSSRRAVDLLTNVQTPEDFFIDFARAESGQFLMHEVRN